MTRRVCIGLAVALVAVGNAAAALEERLTISSARPKVGEVTSITLRPYWLFTRADGTCCDYQAADVNYPYRIQLLTRGRTQLVRPSRTADPSVWAARVRFRTSGRWRVRVMSGYTSTTCVRVGCPYVGPELRVQVRR